MKKMTKERYKVLDLFCGCGGLSEGFSMAGYDIIGGIDLNKSAVDTFGLNFENANAICANLLEIKSDNIMNEFSTFLNADIIIGGPPCQGFSNANRYSMEEDDDRNKLFYEFLKFVDVIKPKVIVIENVRGIITTNNGYAKKRIYELFEERGYVVNHEILDASEFGVPQRRIRNFFVITEEKKFNFSKLKKKEAHTVYDSISELYNLEGKSNKEGVYLLESSPTNDYAKYLRREDNYVHNHIIKYPADFVQHRISFVPQGGNWRDVPPELLPNKRTNRHSSAYKRLKENDLSVTIDTGNTHSNYFHPIYNRIPTVREAARLQSFSDKFIFTGSRTEQYIQVGNAVPPKLAYTIANAIKEEVLDE